MLDDRNVSQEEVPCSAITFFDQTLERAQGSNRRDNRRRSVNKAVEKWPWNVTWDFTNDKSFNAIFVRVEKSLNFMEHRRYLA